MAHHEIPDEPPPPYSSEPQAPSTSQQPSPQPRANLPDRNGIPPERRRSMEDETRPLPQGWVRTFDTASGHQFFVDTTTAPPRSIWTHPYDDEQYLASLPRAERARIEAEPTMVHRQPSQADMMAEHTDEDDEREHHGGGGGGDLPARPAKLSLGRRIKDRMTGTTHEQRDAARRRRAREERDAYQRHLAIRRAMRKAIETGRPQRIGTDREGNEVYVQPPAPFHGPGLGASRGGTLGGRSMFNPYSAGMYSAPSARYARPSGPYRRPVGYGYGGGYGMPLGLGLGAGLLGGVMIGEMVGGGGMGMGGFDGGGMGGGGGF